MTASYSLAPEPFWYIVNNDGTPSGGAKLYTRSTLDFQREKKVYKDAGGEVAWTNPIIFNMNGVQGPFYWEFDPDFPDDLYYIFVNDAEGNLIWGLEDFSPGSGGGGGSVVTTILPLFNYIANNQFIDHIETTDTTSVTNLVIAPSNHKGFTPAYSTPPVTTPFGVVGPDIRFSKNSTANTDQISFPTFALADSPMVPDITPVDYLDYQCSTNNTGEDYKVFQFPITQKVKNLSNQIMTFKLWAAVETTPITLTAYTMQYFGSTPTASATVRTIIGTMDLTTTWTPFYLTFTVEDVASGSLGTLNQQTDDDALYIIIQPPLNTACHFKFTKPALYLGEIDNQKEFEDYDQINSINSTPRTGDIKVSLNTSPPLGWVAMDDGTIGNVGSGAINRANKDTFQLYTTIYTSVTNDWAPVSSGRTPPGNTMTAAIADFVNNKTLTLPRSLGRAMAGAGSGSGLTPRELGEYVGSEVITIDAMPSHTHGLTVPFNIIGGTGPTIHKVDYASGSPSPPIYGIFQTNTVLTTAATGGVSPASDDGNMEPTSFMNVFIKL